MKILAWPAFSNRKLNPYNYLLYSHLQELGFQVTDVRDLRKNWLLAFRKFDILHLHWPEYALNLSPIRAVPRILVLLLLILKAKMSGAKTVWTVHNFRPHDSRSPRWLERLFYFCLTNIVDGVIFLSEVSRTQAQSCTHLSQLRRKPQAVVPLGHYRQVYPPPVSRDEARRQLGYDPSNFILLFIGLVRPYKGLERLIPAFRQVGGDHLRLRIAGKPLTNTYAEELRELAQDDPRIYLDLRFVDDSEVGILLTASDLVVLPYNQILNSSSALLALSYGRPVLAPKTGSLIELSEEVGSDWVILYKTPFLAETLQAALSSFKPPSGEPNLEPYTWERIASATAAFFSKGMEG